MHTATTQAITRPGNRGHRSDTHLVIGLTAISLTVQVVAEFVVVGLQPDRSPHLLQNTISVSVGSVLGLALVWALVLLGRRDKLRAPLAWLLAVLGLAASAVFFFLALPTTLAAGAYVLARPGSGSLRAARVVAIVGIASSFVVSLAMLHTYL